MERIRIATIGITAFGWLFWIVALAGLSSLAAQTCADMVRAEDPDSVARARCSQLFAWPWWALWFEFFLLVTTTVLSIKSRFVGVRHLVAATPALTQLFTIASVVTMLALQFGGEDVWSYTNAMLRGDRLDDAARASYASGSAKHAGFVLLTLVNLAFVIAVPLVDTEDFDLRGAFDRLRARRAGAGSAAAPAAGTELPVSAK